MAPRAYWKGYLKLSLVSCPIALFPATSEREKIRFHQINQATGNRIRYVKVDAESGEEVGTENIVKGYQVGKSEYLEIEPDELEAIAIESKRTIDIESSCPRTRSTSSTSTTLITSCPTARSGVQAFAVIREAIRKEGMVAIGKVVFTTREHVIALQPRDKGMLGMTLRYPYEIRKAKRLFRRHPRREDPQGHARARLPHREHQDRTVRSAQIRGPVRGRAQGAAQAQAVGQADRAAGAPKSAQVINLMDALRKSVAAERPAARRKASGGGRRPAAHSRRGTAKRGQGRRKAG